MRAYAATQNISAGLVHLLIYTSLFFPLPTLSLHSKSKLELESKLQVFKSCSINIVQNHINLPYNAQNDGTYSLKPFQNIPTVLSFYRFNLRPNPLAFLRLAGDMYCDEFELILSPNQGFKFRAPPNPKSTCSVQIYTDPVPCKKWVSGKLSYLAKKLQQFSGKIFDTIFDHRIHDDYLNQARVGLFFIHVTNRLHLEPFAFEPLFQIDFYWQIQRYFQSYNFILPTKILFQLGQGDTMNSVQVVRTSLLSCQNYEEW